MAYGSPAVKVKRINFALAIAYIILVLRLLGWALFHQPRERRGASDRKPLLKFIDEDEANSLTCDMMRTLL